MRAKRSLPWSVRSSEGLGGAGGGGGRQGILLFGDYLTNAQKIAIRIYDCELSKAPRFIF